MKSFLFATLFLCLKISRLQVGAEEIAAGETDNSTQAVTSVLMVCSQNDCRSPIAAAVFTQLTRVRGIDHKWRCDSAGIYVYQPEMRWKPDKRARVCLHNHGIMDTDHICRMVEEKDFDEFDYIFGMDLANVEDLNEKAPKGSRAKIALLSSYDPLGSEQILNPAYDEDTKGFDLCFKIAKRSIAAFLDRFA